MIPKTTVEQVTERANIVEVISERISLKKRGQNFIGLCPFHSEKTPSFTVSEAKRIFYCFGCHTGGDVVSFLMKYDGVSFHEALGALAKRYGIKISEEKKNTEVDDILGLNRLAEEFFMKTLKGSGGARGKAYLKQRGYEGEILDIFKIGYAPQKADALSAYIKEKGGNLSLAEKIGLIGKKSERYYDRFRERIMFPIADSKGRTIAFGGRSIDGSPPKYLNSPESSVFKKSSALYGLHGAREWIGKKGSAIVVEGYFDLVSLHAHGFTNVVATMGTALTQEHLRRLKPYAKVVYTLFDSDDAGKNASLRALSLFLEEGLNAMAIMLSTGKDPEEFLNKEGEKGFERAIKEAIPLMDFLLNELKTRFDISTPHGKGAYFDAVIPYIMKITNVAERGHYASKLGELLRMDIKSVYSAMEMLSRRDIPPSEALKEVIKPHPTRIAESMILEIVLKHPELSTEEVLEAFEKFKDPFLKEVSLFVRQYLNDRERDARRIFDRIEDKGIKDFVADALFKEKTGFIESPEKMLGDCVRKVLGSGRPSGATMAFLKKLEESGRTELVRKILERIGKEKV